VSSRRLEGRGGVAAEGEFSGVRGRLVATELDLGVEIDNRIDDDGVDSVPIEVHLAAARGGA
jgi:hypothetical protein